ncbi:MAG: methylmalonyl-CoA mutase family protein [Bacteroidota bacterium]
MESNKANFLNEELDLSVFEPSGYAQWKEEAQRTLKIEEVESTLSWETSEIRNLKPYYAQEDLQGISKQIDFFQQLPSHSWKLYQRVIVVDEKVANQEALDGLVGGCDGIIFEISDRLDEKTLLKDIDITICDVSSTKHLTAANTMTPDNCLKVADDLSVTNHILSAIDQIRNQHEWITRTAFTDFFLEIAAIRALRFLLADVHSGKETKIHSVASMGINEEQQWFLNTTCCLASILGGSYSIEPRISKGGARITRNVGNIIREECYVEKYEDQCGGAFYVEALTNKIIHSVQQRLK